jgi:hypothetical protein
MSNFIYNGHLHNADRIDAVAKKLWGSTAISDDGYAAPAPEMPSWHELVQEVLDHCKVKDYDSLMLGIMALSLIPNLILDEGHGMRRFKDSTVATPIYSEIKSLLDPYFQLITTLEAKDYEVH